MIDFTTSMRVRLIAAERAIQTEIGGAIGVVHGIQGNTVEVSWPHFRSQHKASDLEPAP